MLTFDTRNLEDSTRNKLALHIQQQEDFKLPHLKAWNYDLCRVHRSGWVEDYWDAEESLEKQRTVYDRPKPGCRKCGVHPHAHQRVGIAWLYTKKRALLADTMGSGKTAQAAGLVAMLLETGELPDVGRVVITPRAPALHQWRDELYRMMPGVNVIVAEGTKAQRIDLYTHDWDVLLIGPEMMLNDHEMLERIPLAAFITDDIDTMRNPENRQAYALKRMGRHADRFVIMTGTPFHKRLPELHSTVEEIGGREAFGTLNRFLKEHVRTETVTNLDRYGKVESSEKITGYKHLDVVKEKLAPMTLRRTAADLKDVHLPAIVPDDVYLDLYPVQRAKYNELKKGVLQIMRETGTQTKHLSALTKLHYGAAICGGMATLGEQDGPKTSMKMDWIIYQLTQGSLQDEKIVLFARYKTSIRALQYRLRAAGIGFETVWGEENSKIVRAESQERFWSDPNCRVLMGTTAIEQSLNLQVSRHLVNMDMILNPARMAQLAGRIRRTGSAYKQVYVHNLLTVGTQEERYLPLLEREEALASHIWDETSDLFKALSPMALLDLIGGS